MARTHPEFESAQLWSFVDSRLSEPQARAAMADILSLANSGWGDGHTIDLGAPNMRRLLSDHRLWTGIPLDAVPESVRRELQHQHRTIAATQMRLRLAAARSLACLQEAGCEARVLKGLATSELDYPDASLRHTGDVDLAVRPDQLDQAVTALRSIGYTEQPSPYAPQLLYGRTLDAPDGTELDLHTRLSRRSPHNVPLLDVPGEQLSLVPGQALPRPMRLVHAAAHFLISPPGNRRMSSLLDITMLLRNQPSIDLDEARRFASELSIEGLVGAGIRIEATLSERNWAVAELEHWKPVDWLERRTRLVADRNLVLDHLGRFREVPTGERFRYLPYWLIPRREQRLMLRRTMTKWLAWPQRMDS